MIPVSVGAWGQFLPAFHEQHAGITYLAGTFLFDEKALEEVSLVAFAVCEARARRFGTADAAAIVAAVDLWFMEAKHDEG